MLDMPPELVWDFLSNTWRWAGPSEPPVEKLKRGDIETVLDAAPGDLSCMGCYGSYMAASVSVSGDLSFLQRSADLVI